MSGTNNCPGLQELEGLICDSRVVVMKEGQPTVSDIATHIGADSVNHERCLNAGPLRPDGLGTYIFDSTVLDGFCRAAYEACPLLKAKDQK